MNPRRQLPGVGDPATTVCPADAVADAPCVSIIIPVHNRLDLTAACLDSLFAHTEPDPGFEIIVIDDVSSDGTAEYLDSLIPKIRVIRNAERGSFGVNVNRAARTARGGFLCFLNNDTTVTPGWLLKLVAAAREDPRVGVLGNRHLSPDTGKLHHAGMVFDREGHPVHLHLEKKADFPPANVSRNFQAVTAACWLLRRELFEELGGFDENFRNGYEDVDFCLRVKEAGKTVRYVADSVIYHHGQASPGRTDNERANARYFREKWAGRIMPDQHDFLLADGEIRPAPPVARRAIADDGAADLHFAVPIAAGNSFSWVVAQLALACEDVGMKVSLLPSAIDRQIGSAASSRLRKMMSRPASIKTQIKWTHFWDPYFKQALDGEINAEIFVTNYRYGTQPTAQLDRWMRHVVLNTNRKLPISGYTADALTELGVPEARCRIIPMGYSPEILSTEEADNRFKQHGFVFLAITNSQDPYRLGTDILIKAYAKAFAGRKDVVLVLKDYGGPGSGLVARWVETVAAKVRIEHVREFVPKEKLIALYRGADAFVAPFRGEGFGMKIIDACAVGLPVLAPAYGGPLDYLRPGEFVALKHDIVPVGECKDRKDGIVPDFATWAEVDVDELANQMREIVRAPSAARLGAAAAKAFVLDTFSWQRAAEALHRAVGTFHDQRKAVVSARAATQAPSKALSVVLPTRNRADNLPETLAAYARQSLPAADWELILVDDASGYDVAGLVREQVATLPPRLVVNQARLGASGARNRGISETNGRIVLLAGEGTVPGPDFLREHLLVHQQQSDDELAVLGRIDWHPNLKISPFMEYLAGRGGHRFNFNRLTPRTFVPYNDFQGSNISMKRAALIGQEELFSDKFMEHGYEDIELGFRLCRSGMRIFYQPAAQAFHVHPMTDAEICRQQYKAGRMLVVFNALHPAEVTGEGHEAMFRALEVFQHVFPRDDVRAAQVQIWRERSAALTGWLRGSDGDDVPGIRGNPGQGPVWARRWLDDAFARWADFDERLYGYRLDLALLDGIADEWFGLPEGADNPARDLLRYDFMTRLLPSGQPRMPLVHDSLLIEIYSRWLKRLMVLERKRPLAAAALSKLTRMAVGIGKRLR